MAPRRVRARWVSRVRATWYWKNHLNATTPYPATTTTLRTRLTQAQEDSSPSPRRCVAQTCVASNSRAVNILHPSRGRLLGGQVIQTVLLPHALPGQCVEVFEGDVSRAAVGHGDVDAPAVAGDEDHPVVRRPGGDAGAGEVGRGGDGGGLGAVGGLDVGVGAVEEEGDFGKVPHLGEGDRLAVVA